MNAQENKIVNEFLQNTNYENYKIEFSTENIVSVRVYFVTAKDAYKYYMNNKNTVNDIRLVNSGCSANIVNLILQKRNK